MIGMLPQGSCSQRRWKCLSMAFHFMLWLALVKPDSAGGIADSGGSTAGSQAQSKTARLIVPVLAMPSNRAHAPSPGIPFNSDEPTESDLLVNVKGLQLMVAYDPTFEMLDVLQREQGRIGCAEPTTPRLLELVFAVGDSNSGTDDRAWHRYFPLRFQRFQSEMPAEYQRCVDHGTDSKVIGYALFPKRFEKDLEIAIRAEASRQRLTGTVIRADIRFDTSTNAGFRVEAVQVGGKS